MKSKYRIVYIAFTLALMAGAAIAQNRTEQSDKRQSASISGSSDAEGASDAGALPVAWGRSETGDLEALLASPSNVAMRKDLRPFVARLLMRSPTFRNQFERIRNTSNLQVAIELVTSQAHLPYQARCIVEKADGLITVKMELVVLRPIPEMMGHEFEHLMEQLEGVNLRTLAAQKGSGVIRQPDGGFETKRAILAGKAVAREYLSASRQK